MYSSLKALIVFAVMSLTLAGCGDLLGTKVVKRQLDGSQFEVQCEMDMEKFSQIMHENIRTHISCLGENLRLFIRIVKSGKPGYLSRVQLEHYLAKHRPDVKPEAVKALKAVFDLGHLITGEDPEYISRDTVDKIINFAIVFNQEAALNFGPIFKNESPVTYALHMNHRDRVSSANKSIIQALRTIFNPNRNGQIHKLNIIDLLESFSTEVTRPDIEKAKKILFVKKVLFGGENEIITHHELEKVILNFDHLLLIGLDAIRYKYIILNQESILQLLKRDVSDLYEIITQGALNNRDGEVLFTVDQAVEAAKLFVDRNKLDIDKFRSLINEVKLLVMKGNTSQVKGGELKNLFQEAKGLLQTGTVFHRIYHKFKAQLDGPRPVEETINFDEYRHTYPEHQAELNHFERISKNYRFMRGEFLSSYYTRGFKRNPDAFFEIALLEYGIRLIFSKYGQTSNGVGGYSIDKFKMQDLIKKFENELIDLELLMPQKAEATADNISLLGTLFQYQSDKNGLMDVNEAAEFGVSLISALNITADIKNYLKDRGCTLDEFGRVEGPCFRANFWPALCTYYRSNFPLMFDSFKAPKNCEENLPDSPNEAPSWVNADMEAFLARSSSAARVCEYYTDGKKEEIPFSDGDIMTILLAMMHAETTVVRWDTNLNNSMDADEVDRAYEIYSPALDGFLLDKNPVIKLFKKQIYQYMIKYEQVPDEKNFGSIWKFIRFLASFNKKSDANRKTIVSILDVIGKENEKLQTTPPFDCNLHRNPDTIPREPEVPGTSANLSTAMEAATKEMILPETASFISTLSRRQKWLLRGELILFSDDMAAERVRNIGDVKQPALKNLFYQLSQNRAQWNEINAAFEEGPAVHKLGMAAAAILLKESSPDKPLK